MPVTIDIDATNVLTLAEAKFGPLAMTKIMLATAGALTIEAEKIMTDSKQHYVPVDTGNLKSTGHVRPVQLAGANMMDVTLGFGGPAAPYALIVHERPPYIGQGMNKYLSKPFQQARGGMAERIMARVMKAALS